MLVSVVQLQSHDVSQPATPSSTPHYTMDILKDIMLRFGEGGGAGSPRSGTQPPNSLTGDAMQIMDNILAPPPNSPTDDVIACA